MGWVASGCFEPAKPHTTACLVNTQSVSEKARERESRNTSYIHTETAGLLVETAGLGTRFCTDVLGGPRHIAAVHGVPSSACRFSIGY